VLEDVADEYVTPERAAKDYGVVVREIDRDLGEWEVDRAATEAERSRLRASRRERLEEDPAAIVARYRRGEIDQLDLIRHHGVILNWDTGELLPHTTEQFRAMVQRRAAAHW
jgi:N-methylhydantoinase B